MNYYDGWIWIKTLMVMIVIIVWIAWVMATIARGIIYFHDEYL